MDQPRNDAGQYISWEKFVLSIMDERFDSYRRELAFRQQALELQAREYERRLTDLNHAHARAQEALNTFVRIDKYEDKMLSEAEAREIALERLDEKIASLSLQMNTKLDDYITKTEARQAELDQAIASQKGAAAEAQRAAEEMGRKSQAQAEAQHRKTNRNMAIAGLLLTIIIAVSQWIGVSAEPPPPPPPTVTTTP